MSEVLQPSVELEKESFKSTPTRTRVRLPLLAKWQSRPTKSPRTLVCTQELLEAPAEQREAMLENIAMALTRLLLKENPGIGARDFAPSRQVREVSSKACQRSGVAISYPSATVGYFTHINFVSC